MSTNANWLRFMGLTNHDTEDIGQLMTLPDSRTGAFCESDRCRGDRVRIEKYVDQDTDMCPDCGHALVWRQTCAPLETHE